jgi:hypothetical protein
MLWCAEVSGFAHRSHEALVEPVWVTVGKSWCACSDGVRVHASQVGRSSKKRPFVFCLALGFAVLGLARHARGLLIAVSFLLLTSGGRPTVEDAARWAVTRWQSLLAMMPAKWGEIAMKHRIFLTPVRYAFFPPALAI